MARPVTLFTGQWADLPFEVAAEKAKSFGYDGIELPCWGDHFDVREASPGLLLATAPLGADRSPAGLRALAGRTTDRLRTTFGNDLRLLDWAVGDRPMPPGGPVIGQVTPGVHVAVMHSAICLAPVAGRLLAGEIRTGRPAPRLAACRPAQSRSRP